MFGDLEGKLSAARARLGKAKAELEALEAEYDARMAAATDAEAVRLAERREAAIRAVSLETDRLRAAEKAITDRDAAAAREAEAAAWREVQSTLTEADKLAERVEADIATAGKSANALLALIGRLPALTNPEGRRDVNEARFKVCDGVLTVLIRSKLGDWAIPNSKELRPTDPSIADAVRRLRTILNEQHETERKAA